MVHYYRLLLRHGFNELVGTLKLLAKGAIRLRLAHCQLVLGLALVPVRLARRASPRRCDTVRRNILPLTALYLRLARGLLVAGPFVLVLVVPARRARPRRLEQVA